MEVVAFICAGVAVFAAAVAVASAWAAGRSAGQSGLKAEEADWDARCAAKAAERAAKMAEVVKLEVAKVFVSPAPVVDVNVTDLWSNNGLVTPSTHTVIEGSE